MTSKISQIIDEKEDFHPYPLRFDFVGKLNLYEMVVMRQHHEATYFLKSHFNTFTGFNPILSDTGWNQPTHCISCDNIR